ncbi:MAG: PA14 domain-containing protein [Planctomycetota bacterium]
MGGALARTALAAGLLAVSAAAQQDAYPAPADRQALLLTEKQCFRCHQAPAGLERQLPDLGAPSLDLIGERATGPWIEAFLREPQALRPGTRMPHLLDDLDAEARAQAAGDLAAFLLSRSGGMSEEGVEVSPEMLAEGEELFDTVGCRACHADAFADRRLAEMSTVAALRDQLLDPLAVRPSGRMPDLHLDEEEATAIAAWLLRAQRQGEGRMQLLPGLRWQAYAWDGAASTGPTWEEERLFAEGVALEIHEDYGGREERYGLLFDGLLVVPQDGSYTFGIASDDGNTLSLDGEMVLDARYMQSHTAREVTVRLTTGLHPIRISYYEGGGDQSLEAWWSGPGFEEEPLEGDVLQHEGEVFLPLVSTPAHPAVDVERGRQLYLSRGCIQCHEAAILGGPPAPDFGSLRAERGCLAPAVPAGLPDFKLEAGERGTLNAALRSQDWLSRQRQPAERLATTLEALACTACHARQGLDGPSPATLRGFTGDGDLGDEGRVPPALDGVEDKLQPAWLEEVLVDGAMVREAMHTRMPAYGDARGTELTALLLALATPEPERDAAFSEEKIEMGRTLAGNGGFACISCHGLAGYPSTGIEGLDLADAAERLRPSWFKRWLRDPHSIRSTTRMPVFWDESGRSAQRDHADGRAAPQIEALWSYLALGEAMPLPAGLVVDPDSFALVPVDRPVYFGTFMEGLSPRVLTVGFPERISLAFDEEHVRLAQVWKGEFMNAEGTWNGRAGQLESPAGSEIRELPPGPPFAFGVGLADWPTVVGREAGWRMQGHRRDADGNPTFRYRHGTLEVEESFEAVLAADGPWLRRRFLLRSQERPQDLRRITLAPQGGGRVETVDFQREGDAWIARIEEELRW